MKIKTKIFLSLLGMSLLVALVGVLAVNRQYTSAMLAATTEAKGVAHALGLAVMSDAGRLDSSAQKIVSRLHQTERRDIVVLDFRKRVLADAIPGNAGESFTEDRHDEVAATLSDGIPRTFVEISDDYPAGIKQIVSRVTSSSGETLGAVILEYTPLYNELMKSTEATIRQLVVTVGVSLILALLTAFYMGRSIARPLSQLTWAATAFASGRTDLPLPPSREDEIGELTKAFDEMIQKREGAKGDLQRLYAELETRVAERTAQLARMNEALLAENSERKLAEVALRESKHFAESVAQNSTSIIYVYDIESNRSLYTNQGAGDFLGYSQEQVFELGDNLLPTIIHPEDLSKVAQHFAAFAEAADDRIVDLEYRVRHVSGDYHWVWSRDTVFKRRANGVAWQIMSTCQDITERKRSEAELEQIHKDLLEASRLAGMAEVATGVLHNVGNVLNSLNISATLVAQSVQKSKVGNLGRVVALLDEHALNLGAFVSGDEQGRNLPSYLRRLYERMAEEQRSILAEIDSLRQNVEHIKEIVSMQQEYARVSGVTEIVKVSDLVDDSLRMNGAALTRHGVAVDRDFHEVPPLIIEKHKALQILVNLIRNAKYACDEGGREDKRITLGVINGHGRVKISVSDNGIGIPPENLTRIFNHGFTTRKDGHGFGLHSGALAARELGGKLIVHSDGYGKGATFTLELPAGGSAQ